MRTDEIKQYYDQHCRFKLKSGKEVYGVIWEVNNGDSSRTYFSSLMDHQAYLKDQSIPDLEDFQLEEILFAEKLVS